MGETLIHWGAAGLTLTAAGVALFLLSPPNWSEIYVQRYMAGIEHHKTMGLLALVLAVAWPIARTVRRPRPGPETEQALAKVVHLGLFASLIILPVSGYLSSTLFGNGLTLSGLATLPPLLPENRAMAAALHLVHKWGGYVFLALAALHTVAALTHALRDAAAGRSAS